MSELVEYMRRSYTLVIDNEPGTQWAASQAALDVLRADGVTLSEYRGMSSSARRERFAATIGANVMTLVDEWITDAVPDSQASAGAMLIHEVMFFAGSSTELDWVLGEHYMPEDSDVDGVLSDEDDEV